MQCAEVNPRGGAILGRIHVTIPNIWNIQNIQWQSWGRWWRCGVNVSCDRWCIRKLAPELEWPTVQKCGSERNQSCRTLMTAFKHSCKCGESPIDATIPQLDEDNVLQ